jgi:hypothetical protein
MTLGIFAFGGATITVSATAQAALEAIETYFSTNDVIETGEDREAVIRDLVYDILDNANIMYMSGRLNSAGRWGWTLAAEKLNRADG